MKLSPIIVCSSLVASASGFAPASSSTQHSPKSSLSAFSAYYEEDAQAEANARMISSEEKLPGDLGFDPLGYSKRDYGTTGKSTNGN